MPRPLQAMGCFFLFCFLLAQTLATSATLHLALHKDAHHQQHTCAIKDQAREQIDLAPVAIEIHLPEVRAFQASAVHSFEVLPVSGTLPQGRAPPLNPAS